MRAKEYLRQLEKLDSMIENKLIERQRWRDLATDTTAAIRGERVQSSGNQQRMESAIVSMIELEREIDACIDRLVDTRRDVISVIEQLNATEYDLLHKIYVQHIPIYDVAAKSDKSYSWTTTVHGRALKNVQNILDAREGEQ